MKNASSEMHVGTVRLQLFCLGECLLRQTEMIDGSINIDPVEVKMILREQTDRGQKSWIVSNGLGQELNLMFGLFGSAASDGAGAISTALGRLQIKIVGDDVFRRLGVESRRLFRGKFCLKLIGDRARDFALNRKHVGELAVISLSPKMCVSAGVDQLRVD